MFSIDFDCQTPKTVETREWAWLEFQKPPKCKSEMKFNWKSMIFRSPACPTRPGVRNRWFSVFKRILIGNQWFSIPGLSRSIPCWIRRGRGSENYRFPLKSFYSGTSEKSMKINECIAFLRWKPRKARYIAQFKVINPRSPQNASGFPKETA